MSGSSRSRLPLVVAVVVGLLLIVGVRLLTGDGDGGSAGSEPGSGARPSGDCVVLTVAASSEKAALLRDMAADYATTGPEADGRCVDVQVVSKASGGAAEALSRGWDEDVDGPRPDVWSPASSSWTVLVRQRLAERDAPDVIPEDLPSVAQTPLVLAMPRPMAQALGWPEKELGWTDLVALSRDPAGWGSVGHPEWGRFKLGKTNPNFSTSGLNATIGAYFAATGLSSDLTVADVTDPKTVAYVSEVESSVVHYGDTTLTFLANLQRAATEGQGLTYVSAVTVEEKSVWDYNQGNPSGDPKTLGQAPKPSVPLVAVYPREGTLLSDNPYVVLTADWVDAVKRTAAAGFLEYIQQPDQQRRFQEAAFRTFEGEPGDVITPDNGMLPDRPTAVLAPPAPTVLDAVQRSWDQLRKRARVLLVLDVSGSMGEPVPSVGATKLALAQEATAEAVGLFAKDDEVGLWVFSTRLGPNGEPWLQRVPIGPAATTQPTIVSAVAGLVPEGGTGLYATLREAHEQMLANLDTDRINAIVVLTDGRNEYPADNNLSSLLRDLEGESLDTSVRVFPIAYGEDADLEALTAIAEASQAAVYDASDPASIEKVLISVVSNF
ncbi:MAG: substrate-binding and VWA domain-containing protein [Actinomycetia bacterium]|nr:substrate-binding and VWA domain-containing protein [Actinomycetes bacterium]